MDDLISRQEAIDALGEAPTVKHDSRVEHGMLEQWKRDTTAIKTMPSAQPERKRGKWIDYVNSHCECSVCHTEWSYFQNETECFEFCPNCGADMREVDDERPD